MGMALLAGARGHRTHDALHLAPAETTLATHEERTGPSTPAVGEDGTERLGFQWNDSILGTLASEAQLIACQ